MCRDDVAFYGRLAKLKYYNFDARVEHARIYLKNVKEYLTKDHD